jgi:hypothetical protein
LRPARSYAPLISRTPLRPDIVAGADVIVLRELCGGSPFGEPRGVRDRADGGSPNSTVIAIAEKASDLLLGRLALAPESLA